MAAATRVVDDNQEKSSVLEKECATLRAEMAAFGKNQQTNASVVESEKKRRQELELELVALQAKERATAIQIDRSRNDESKDVAMLNKARETEREILQKQHQVIEYISSRIKYCYASCHTLLYKYCSWYVFLIFSVGLFLYFSHFVFLPSGGRIEI